MTTAAGSLIAGDSLEDVGAGAGAGADPVMEDSVAATGPNTASNAPRDRSLLVVTVLGRRILL
jgi:hypothetical protein